MLIVELDSAKNPKHLVKAQILNPKGEIIYDEEKELEAQPGNRKPYVAYNIALDPELRSKLIPGSMSIKLYLDGRSFLIKQLTYQDQSVHKKQIAKLVVLPFYSTTNQFFDYKSKDAILSTFSDALKCEAQRYFSNVIPADISEKSVSEMNIKNCFENEGCRNNINKIFGESIFISGNVSLPAANSAWSNPEREVFLEVFLFDSRQIQMKKFRSSSQIKSGDLPAVIMKSLLDDLLVKQGFLLYIRSL